MVLERWDHSSKVHFDRKVLDALVCLRFVESARDRRFERFHGGARTLPMNS